MPRHQWFIEALFHKLYLITAQKSFTARSNTELGLVGWEPDIWVPGLLLGYPGDSETGSSEGWCRNLSMSSFYRSQEILLHGQELLESHLSWGPDITGLRVSLECCVENKCLQLLVQ